MIQIPARLAELLHRDRSLETAVNASLEEFEPWLEAGGKRPTFFPDYTDHSIQHIQEVLATAESLIREEAWPALSPGDAAVLVLAALLHDSAMHLTREGFEALVRPGTRWTPIADFDDRPWPQLWADYTLEARRFDQRKLIDLFGDADPVHVPDLDDLKLDDRTRRLIGEFVRRHHPRLGHEVARYGVPGSTDGPLCIHGDPEIADLAGLVARSHGLSARACLPYLKKHFGRRTDPLGIHAVFLIVLLRVADYLQLQASRAPERTLKVHRIRSPYSAGEWRVHAAVRDISKHEEDREAVDVRAKPQDVETYLRLKSWLEGLQAEIDTSWAVLGEVYSRQDRGMDGIGINVRRMYSNLDDAAEFAATADYIPRQLSFTAAGPNLLKLLVGPLYGDRPEVGARELIQNAVDAVRELQTLRECGLLPEPPAFVQQEGDVVAALDRDDAGTWWLTVSDRGVGMTADVVSDYFLRAGASFRNSEAWQGMFRAPDGHSAVLRSGRFGVGALAAFLLGEEIIVATRHVSADPDEGIAFTARIDTDVIAARKVRRPVGTTIRIKLSGSAAFTLLHALPVDDRRTLQMVGVNYSTDSWDWHCLPWPKVVRIVRPLDRELDQHHRLPDANANLPKSWHRIQIPEFEDVQWTYDQAPALTCNGIVVVQQQKQQLPESGLPLLVPKVSVFDPDANLPLTLTRDALTTGTLPFLDVLFPQVLQDYIRTALRTAPSEPIIGSDDLNWYAGLMYAGIRDDSAGLEHLGHWASTEQGIVPVQSYNLWDLDMTEAFLVPPPGWRQDHTRFFWRTGDREPAILSPTFLFPNYDLMERVPSSDAAPSEGFSIGQRAARFLVDALYGLLLLPSGFSSNGWSSKYFAARHLDEGYEITGWAVIVPKAVFPELESALQELHAAAKEHLQKEIRLVQKRTLEHNEIWYVTGNPEAHTAARTLASHQLTVPVFHCTLRRKSEAPPKSALSETWYEILDSPLIPYDPIARRKLLRAPYRSMLDSDDGK